MKKFGVVLVAMASSVLFAACGNDNVAACEAYLDKASCGTYDFRQYMSCEAYENTSCDISEYFDCLTDNLKCEDGVLDASGQASCAAMASC